MLRDSKTLICGGVLASAAVGATILPSEGEVCLDTRLMCAPIAVHLNDMREDGPRAPGLNKLVITVASICTSFVPIYAGRQTI
jgi:hypothetical protein